jgi:hypothetical protein
MKKNNKAHAQRGHDRHMKNVARKRRATELKKFNNLVAYFKWMDDMKKQQKDQMAQLNVQPAETPAEIG